MASNAKAARANSGERVWIWMQTMSDKDRWSVQHIPAGEFHAPYIKKSSKNSDGSYSYYVYRNGKALGSPKDLDAAKAMCELGKPNEKIAADNRALGKYIDETPRDADKFKALSKLSQTAVANVYPWAMPRKSEMEAKGIKSKATVVRDDLLSKHEKKAVKDNLPMESKIERLKDKNPKKEGSDAWGRWEVMFAHCGQLVGDYVKNHGNPTTLKNAVKMGYVRVKGMA